MILAIDPGLSGAFVWWDGVNFSFEKMPITKTGKHSEISYRDVKKIIEKEKCAHVFLERAKALAMGATHAFNYGRGFAAIEISIIEIGLPVTYVEAHVWTKVILEGTPSDLKTKARASVAVQRLLPQLIDQIPKNRKGVLDEGVVDALLIAEYGRRKMK